MENIRRTTFLYIFFLIVSSLICESQLYVIPGQYYTQTLPVYNRINQPQERLSVADWSSYNYREPEGPGTYAFGYDVDDAKTGNTQFRQEERHPNGTVTGSYGYVEPDGNIQTVYYTADAAGYRVRIENSRDSGPPKAGPKLPPKIITSVVSPTRPPISIQKPAIFNPQNTIYRDNFPVVGANRPPLSYNPYTEPKFNGLTIIPTNQPISPVRGNSVDSSISPFLELPTREFNPPFASRPNVVINEAPFVQNQRPITPILPQDASAIFYNRFIVPPHLA